MMDYAGKYLRQYEKDRYTFFERAAFFLPAIDVPFGAVELPDYSFWQYPVDYSKLVKKTKNVILRLGQGTVQDKCFVEYYDKARQHGMKIGGYHFYDGRVNPNLQADAIIKWLKDKKLDLEIYVDWERNFSGAYEGLKNVVKLMQGIENRVDAKDVGIYSGYYWFIENTNAMTNAAEFAYIKHKSLWLAWYAAAAFVKVPRPWDTWRLWQFGTPAVGTEWGMGSKELDMNRYNGNAGAFAMRYGVSEVPQPKRRVVITGDFEIEES